MYDIDSILQDYWGYSSFRPMQREIIQSILDGHDTLALLPTGGGKSICFQVPAMAMRDPNDPEEEGLCLVITPLIALMKDQVANLRKHDIKAAAIYTGLGNLEIQTVFDNCRYGNYKFLYISPERLASETFREKLSQLPICMIAVDEAHCISQWGYDFRPSYLHIADVRHRLPGIPVLALTATATPEVVKDIQDKLSLQSAISGANGWNVFQTSFERDNLAYIVRYCAPAQSNDTDHCKPAQLLRILTGVPGSSIVYVRNRAKTKEIAEFLRTNNISATWYHAGLSNAEKDQRQQAWKAGDVRVMVATNAFGMGIDKPDVRSVIHLDMPDSIEAYFQEAGRAGRDGLKSYAVLLFSKDDEVKVKRRIQDNYPPKEFIRKVYQCICDFLEVGYESGAGHTWAFPFEEFCQRFHLPMLPAYAAIQILSNIGYIAYADESESSPRIHFLCSREELYSIDLSPLQEQIVNSILRGYTGVFTDFVYLHDEHLARSLSLTTKDLNHELITLAQRNILQYIPRRKTPYISFLLDHEEPERLYITHMNYEDRLEQYTRKISAMLEYAQQSRFCRSQVLLDYFGQTNAIACCKCDVCLAKSREDQAIADDNQ